MSAPGMDCAVLGDVHSDDRVTVWHGAPTPLLTCGYHASRDDSMRQLYKIAAEKRRD